MAVGANTTCDEEETAAFGNRRLTQVALGKADDDAVVVSQLRTAREQWRAQNGRASGEQGGRELPSRAAMADILEALCGALFLDNDEIR